MYSYLIVFENLACTLSQQALTSQSLSENETRLRSMDAFSPDLNAKNPTGNIRGKV